MTTCAAALSTNPTDQTPNPVWPVSRAPLPPNPDRAAVTQADGRRRDSMEVKGAVPTQTSSNQNISSRENMV